MNGLKRLAGAALLSILAIVFLAATLGLSGQFNPTTGRSYPKEITVPFSATPTFDFSTGTAFKITLTGNVTSSTFTGGVQGAPPMTVTICQDGAGLHSFVWPASVKTVGLISIPITAVASTCAIQQIYFDGTSYRPVSLGLLNQ